MSSEVVDYIVVGAGSAGCVLANRLSEDGKHQVALLEAGPADTNIWIHIPIGYGKTMFNKKLNWGFYTDPDHNMLDRQIYWPRGKTLGGCSSINGLIYVRGQKEDYDRWGELGNKGWSWEECLPYFRKLENNDLGSGSTRGTAGPLHATSIKTKHELVEAFIESGVNNGLPRVGDFNTGDQEGVGYYQLTTRNGKRCSTAVAYLNPAKKRANLRVETEAQATRIIMEGKRAVGVEFRQGGQLRTLRARREVILSAGALQSPQLLQLSGIGPADLLQKFGIPVVHNMPGVGENLQDHLQLRLIYEVNKPIVVASVIGATIEWYDSFLYGVVAGLVFNHLFFPSGDAYVGTLLAYATFAVGFLARPLGGVIFGHFGDKIGRKSMLVLTLMIMGVSTVAIGLIPSYETIGIWAPILLLFCRILQGIGLGGEWGGAVLMAFEYAPKQRRGFFASWPQVGLATGLCLASGVVALLSAVLTNEQFLAWGWRIAFLLSAGMVFVGLYIRLTIKESPEFEKVKKENAELQLWKNQPQAIQSAGPKLIFVSVSRGTR